MNNSPLDPTLDAEPADDLDRSDLFAVMADDRRRLTLAALADQSAAVRTEALARTVAAAEAGESRESVSAVRTEQVHVTLHHVHLPKLADAGLVTYDRDGGRVEARVDVDEYL